MKYIKIILVAVTAFCVKSELHAGIDEYKVSEIGDFRFRGNNPTEANKVIAKMQVALARLKQDPDTDKKLTEWAYLYIDAYTLNQLVDYWIIENKLKQGLLAKIRGELKSVDTFLKQEMCSHLTQIMCVKPQAIHDFVATVKSEEKNTREGFNAIRQSKISPEERNQKLIAYYLDLNKKLKDLWKQQQTATNVKIIDADQTGAGQSTIPVSKSLISLAEALQELSKAVLKKK